MTDDLDDLRHKVEEMQRAKDRNDGYVQGCKDAIKHALYVCAFLWSTISLAFNLFGDYAYNHIPLVRQLVDIINGAK